MLYLIVCTILLAVMCQSVSSASVDYTSQVSAQGDRLPDFSFCGYHSSNDALPSIFSVVTTTLSPGSGDQAPRIQKALNNIASAGGGVLLLTAGNYTVDTSLIIPSGVVLRGAGTTKTILLPQSGASTFITMGMAAAPPIITPATNITDTYVGVGAKTFRVVSSSKLSVGQTVMVQRAVTDAWVRQNGMADLVRSGVAQTWLAVGTLVQQPRKIMNISGSQITIDVPLTDSLNSKYMHSQVATYTFPSGSSEMGVEDLGITLLPSCTGAAISDDTCNGNAINISAYTTDSWVRSVNITGFNQFINSSPGAMRITIDSVSMYRDKATNSSSGYPADITIQGTQMLVTGCGTFATSEATTFPIVVQNLTAGPNAVLDYYSQQSSFVISPHQRWAHGLLVEGSRSSISFGNRGTYGTGQGWTLNAGVAWNSNGSDIDIYSPPLGTNWCFGCRWIRSAGNGTFVDPSSTVQPQSLFQAQLAARGSN
ncbi:hypothetical protein BCR39DRAFT_560210 [Naematelia encephala]|uniref:Uncharacterized protein n=1 Tax=Naematelia encephala TaxID=71784 RepID=A0A1Y2AX40_9TREE|nr:hypothetical protein BCR39DRAFT_560210 [Naematelia encephala]